MKIWEKFTQTIILNQLEALNMANVNVATCMTWNKCAKKFDKIWNLAHKISGSSSRTIQNWKKQDINNRIMTIFDV